jgi:hypothetical protein
LPSIPQRLSGIPARRSSEQHDGPLRISADFEVRLPCRKSVEGVHLCFHLFFPGVVKEVFAYLGASLC